MIAQGLQRLAQRFRFEHLGETAFAPQKGGNTAPEHGMVVEDKRCLCIMRLRGTINLNQVGQIILTVVIWTRYLALWSGFHALAVIRY